MLEKGLLPSGALAELANRESRQPQAIYKVHKWFARRLGLSMRALAVALYCETEDEFWEQYLGAPEVSGSMLDPFVGGGTTITEAVRMGMDVIGVDIDPVAVAITDFQMRLSGAESVLDVLHRLKETVGTEIEAFHRVYGPKGEACTAIHHFWVQEHSCGYCGYAFDLHPTWELARTTANGSKVVVCSVCRELRIADIDAETVICSCGAVTTGASGTVDHGRAVCPSCGHREPLIKAARMTGKAPRFRLFAHEVYDPSLGARPSMRERRFVRANAGSFQALNEACAALEAVEGELPMFELGVGHRDGRLSAYNRTQIHALFNPRQLLHLALLLRSIDCLKGDEQRAAAIAFSDHLRTNNMLCGYAGGWRRLRPLFAVRGWHHVVRPVELNPWLDGVGRGTFPNALRRVEKARLQLYKPRGGGPVGSEKLGRARVVRADSADLAREADGSVDLVLTDPPYFDKLDYGDLADFFRPWMRRLGLAEDDRTVEGQLEALASCKDQGDAFADRLAKCLIEATRVLKPGGPFVFTYQAGAAGWCALARALAHTGLTPVRVHPVLGDAGSGDHKKGQAARWDAVVCMRKPVCWAVGADRDLLVDAADRRYAARMAEVGQAASQGNVVFSKLDSRNLTAATLCLASLRKRIRRGGTPLSVALEDLCRA